MDEDEDPNAEERHRLSTSNTQQNSELSSDNVCDSTGKNTNVWMNLKTITTFDSGISIQRESKETLLSPNHVSHKETFYQHEECELYQEQKSDCHNTSSNNDLKGACHLQAGGSKSILKKSSFSRNNVPYAEEVSCKETISHKRLRRRSQSNSLSEGHSPRDLVSSSNFSVASISRKNGTVSDAGNGHSNGSLNPSSSVQSLTRFSPTSLLVESLIDQLCKLMEKDSGKQRKLYHVICERLHQMQLIDDTYTIEEFQFMRSHYQKALYQLLAVAKSSTQSRGTRNIILPLPSSNTNIDVQLYSEQVLEWSRYQHEYQELEYIAKGGFGHVYKVRNKLDGGEYAIKKIFLRYRYVEGFLRSLKEVKMLARLNHPNIVSYKAAWLEPLDDEKYKAQANKSSKSSTSQEGSVSIVSLNSKSKLPLPSAHNETEDSLDIVFQESSPDSLKNTSPAPIGADTNLPCVGKQTESPLPTVVDSVSFNKSSSSHSASESSNSEDGSKSSDDEALFPMKAKDSKRDSQTSILRNWATLYVQMQLCESTLRQWLDLRNGSLPSYPLTPNSTAGRVALSLFKRIVRGVEYIHTQGIVHHDIKPSNIFVNANLKEVQVGDFGLSCCILSKVDKTGAVGENHGEVGTRLYAAPEQLRGKCTSKSDLYSLGIVLLELLQPFHTEMERMKVIQNLRNGKLPQELTTTWPHAARLISDLLVKSATSRPTASELLQKVDALIRSNSEHDVSSQLASKDETIRLLQEAVASRDQEIAELRRRLSLFEKE